jgi:hypothetical protein
MCRNRICRNSRRVCGLPAPNWPGEPQACIGCRSPRSLFPRRSTCRRLRLTALNLAGLGYPGFEHVRSKALSNPAAVVLSAVVAPDLDSRLVEALPWVLSAFADLRWEWLRDRAKLRNAQNRLGYLVHLAEETARGSGDTRNVVQVLSKWREDLEEARLAREGTLCRDSMLEPERVWLRANRPEAAAHWNILTGLTAGQLLYAAH